MNMQSSKKTGDPQEKVFNLLEWWYALTAPSEAPENASLSRREVTRRGRLSSTILLGLLLFLVAALPVGEIYRSLFYIFLPSLLISIIVLYLNRQGRLTLAGIILLVGFEVGYLSGLIITPSGLDVNDLPRFDLLIEIVLLAASFLPPGWVFLVAFVNSLFIWIVLTYMPHAPGLDKLLAISAYTVIETPIALQVLVAFVAFLWVSSAQRAIKRADRAELVAALQEDIAAQASVIAEQKRELERSIQRIIETHTQVANGNFKARVPLNEQNVLWEVAGSLNNLLSRFQRLHQSEKEYMQARGKAVELAQILRTSKNTRTPLYVHRTGTMLDTLVIELRGNYLIPPISRYQYIK